MSKGSNLPLREGRFNKPDFLMRGKRAPLAFVYYDATGKETQEALLAEAQNDARYCLESSIKYQMRCAGIRDTSYTRSQLSYAQYLNIPWDYKIPGLQWKDPPYLVWGEYFYRDTLLLQILKTFNGIYINRMDLRPIDGGQTLVYDETDHTLKKKIKQVYTP